jgi:chromosome segregation ATPase
MGASRPPASSGLTVDEPEVAADTLGRVSAMLESMWEELVEVRERASDVELERDALVAQLADEPTKDLMAAIAERDEEIAAMRAMLADRPAEPEPASEPPAADLAAEVADVTRVLEQVSVERDDAMRESEGLQQELIAIKASLGQVTAAREEREQEVARLQTEAVQLRVELDEARRMLTAVREPEERTATRIDDDRTESSGSFDEEQEAAFQALAARVADLAAQLDTTLAERDALKAELLQREPTEPRQPGLDVEALAAAARDSKARAQALESEVAALQSRLDADGRVASLVAERDQLEARAVAAEGERDSLRSQVEALSASALIRDEDLDFGLLPEPVEMPFDLGDDDSDEVDVGPGLGRDPTVTEALLASGPAGLVAALGNSVELAELQRENEELRRRLAEVDESPGDPLEDAARGLLEASLDMPETPTALADGEAEPGADDLADELSSTRDALEDATTNLARAHADLEQVDGELQRHMLDAERARAAEAALRTELEEARVALAEVDDRLNHAVAARDAATSDLDALQRRVTELEAESVERSDTAQVGAMLDAFAREEDDAAAVAAIAADDAELVTLREALAEAEADKTELQAALALASTTIVAAAASAASDDDGETLQARLDAQVDAVDALTRKVAALESERDEAVAAREAMLAHAVALESAEGGGPSIEVVALREERDAAADRAADLEVALSQATQKLADFSLDRATARTEVDETTRALGLAAVAAEEVNRELARAREELVARSEQVVLLEAQVLRLNEAEAEARLRQTELADELASLRAATDDARAEVVQELEASRLALEVRADSAEAEVVLLTARVAELQEAEAALRASLDQAERQHVQAQEASEARAQQLQSQLADTVQSRDEVSAVVSTLQGSVQTVRGRLDEVRDERDEAFQRLEGLEAALADATSEVERVQLELLERQVTREALQTAVTALDTEATEAGSNASAEQALVEDIGAARDQLLAELATVREEREQSTEDLAQLELERAGRAGGHGLRAAEHRRQQGRGRARARRRPVGPRRGPGGARAASTCGVRGRRRVRRAGRPSPRAAGCARGGRVAVRGRARLGPVRGPR